MLQTCLCCVTVTPLEHPNPMDRQGMGCVGQSLHDTRPSGQFVPALCVCLLNMFILQFWNYFALPGGGTRKSASTEGNSVNTWLQNVVFSVELQKLCWNVGRRCRASSVSEALLPPLSARTAQHHLEKPLLRALPPWLTSGSRGSWEGTFAIALCYFEAVLLWRGYLFQNSSHILFS